MKGIDDFPFYGYLSIPKLKGKYPIQINNTVKEEAFVALNQ
jgi:hypothetical protein